MLRKKFDTVEEVLALCVGDTIDAPSRSAFPKNRAALLAKPRGADMFEIGRDALERVAEHINGYKPSASNPNKFMRGYGLFQYDLQFFLKDADFFLSKEWARFDGCMAKLLAELKDCLHKVGLQNKSSLTDLEMCAVAIAYNKGSYNPALGLKQGHKSDGKFYGENIFDFIALSRQAPWTGAVPTDIPAVPGPVNGVVERSKVIAREGLRLRGGPGSEFPVFRVVAFGTIVDVLRKRRSLGPRRPGRRWARGRAHARVFLGAAVGRAGETAAVARPAQTRFWQICTKGKSPCHCQFLNCAEPGARSSAPQAVS